MMQHGNESKDILTSRVKKICIVNNINMYKCLLDSNYYSFVKKQMCSSPNQHEDGGYIDILRMLLKDRNEENTTLLKLLLKPYLFYVTHYLCNLSFYL